MDWTKLAILIATQVPKAVLGVEAIVTGAKQGATKKQLAMASLGLASSVATDALPTDVQPAVSAATTLVSSAIDNFVLLMNMAKGKTPETPALTPTTTAPFSNPDWKSQ